MYCKIKMKILGCDPYVSEFERTVALTLSLIQFRKVVNPVSYRLRTIIAVLLQELVWH